MRKKYVSPEIHEIEIESLEMIAASVQKGEGTVDPGSAWSNQQRNDWGNIWNN